MRRLLVTHPSVLLVFLNQAGKDGVVHPLQHVLSKLWPVLEALPTHFLDARVVMRELCELYRAVFLALQTATIRILPKMLTNMNDMYAQPVT